MQHFRYNTHKANKLSFNDQRIFRRERSAIETAYMMGIPMSVIVKILNEKVVRHAAAGRTEIAELLDEASVSILKFLLSPEAAEMEFDARMSFVAKMEDETFIEFYNFLTDSQAA